jgi:hypothetical protein
MSATHTHSGVAAGLPPLGPPPAQPAGPLGTAMMDALRQAKASLDVNQRVELRRHSGGDRHTGLQSREIETAAAIDGQFLNRVVRNGARDRVGFVIDRRRLALHVTMSLA